MFPRHMVEHCLRSSLPVAVTLHIPFFIISLLLVTFVSKALLLLSQKRTLLDIAAQQDFIVLQEPSI